MVKTLLDHCLQYVSNHSEQYDTQYLSSILTRQQKEELLKRMTSHNQLSLDSLHFVKTLMFAARLRKIELHHNNFVQDFMLSLIAENTKNIEYLSIYDCKNITDGGLSLLLSNQKRLSFLRLQALPLVMGQCLQCLYSPRLETLILRNMTKLQDHYVVEAVSKSPAISYLDLQYCPEISDFCIVAMAAILKYTLAVLKISGVAKITDYSLEVLSANCKKLKKLKLYGCNRLSKEGIDTLLQTIELESIDISYSCAYNGSDLAHFNSAEFVPTLKCFTSCGVQMPANVIIDLATQCRSLTVLVLCGIQAVDDISIKEITKICGTTIKTLDLSYCRQLSDRGLGSIVQQCVVMERFIAQHFLGTGKHFARYGNVDTLQQSKSFTRLYLPGCPLFDSSIFHSIIPYMTSLVELNVAGMKLIDDVFLDLLATHCNHLEYLNVKGCIMISDRGICSLVPYLKLSTLVISGIHNLTDKSIFMISSSLSTTLESLYISGCALISPHVVQYLKDVCVKGVFVQHRIPNAPHDRLMARNLDTGEFCRMDDGQDNGSIYHPTV